MLSHEWFRFFVNMYKYRSQLVADGAGLGEQGGPVGQGCV